MIKKIFNFSCVKRTLDQFKIFGPLVFVASLWPRMTSDENSDFRSEISGSKLVSTVNMKRKYSCSRIPDSISGSLGKEFENIRFEILSMLDSEICTVAPVFYFSIMSSYSMNIQQERIVRTNGVTRFVSWKFLINKNFWTAFWKNWMFTRRPAVPSRRRTVPRRVNI